MGFYEVFDIFAFLCFCLLFCLWRGVREREGGRGYRHYRDCYFVAAAKKKIK